MSNSNPTEINLPLVADVTNPFVTIVHDEGIISLYFQSKYLYLVKNHELDVVVKFEGGILVFKGADAMERAKKIYYGLLAIINRRDGLVVKGEQL